MRILPLGAILLGLAITGVLTACGKEKPATSRSEPKPAGHFFDVDVGGKTVRMQLAVLPGEQERGLMFRRDLGPNDGMLFVYAKPQQVSFWMRNTPTPLDIGYFDADGVLVEVYPLQPFDEAPVKSRSGNIKFPLEMNQGWFSANAVKPGARLDLKAISKALQERGFDPAKYGL